MAETGGAATRPPLSFSAESLRYALCVPTLFFAALTQQSSPMTTVRLNYDGWLSLPSAVRQKLGLTTGDRLELELSDGGLFLRPVRPGAVEAASAPVATTEPSVSATPPAAAAAAPMVKRGPGRPRKTALPTVPPTLKARGGKRKAAVADGPAR